MKRDRIKNINVICAAIAFCIAAFAPGPAFAESEIARFSAGTDFYVCSFESETAPAPTSCALNASVPLKKIEVVLSPNPNFPSLVGSFQLSNSVPGAGLVFKVGYEILKADGRYWLGGSAVAVDADDKPITGDVYSNPANFPDLDHLPQIIWNQITVRRGRVSYTLRFGMGAWSDGI